MNHNLQSQNEGASETLCTPTHSTTDIIAAPGYSQDCHSSNGAPSLHDIDGYVTRRSDHIRTKNLNINVEDLPPVFRQQLEELIRHPETIHQSAIVQSIYGNDKISDDVSPKKSEISSKLRNITRKRKTPDAHSRFSNCCSIENYVWTDIFNDAPEKNTESENLVAKASSLSPTKDCKVSSDDKASKQNYSQNINGGGHSASPCENSIGSRRYIHATRRNFLSPFPGTGDNHENKQRNEASPHKGDKMITNVKSSLRLETQSPDNNIEISEELWTNVHNSPMKIQGQFQNRHNISGNDLSTVQPVSELKLSSKVSMKNTDLTDPAIVACKLYDAHLKNNVQKQISQFPHHQNDSTIEQISQNKPFPHHKSGTENNGMEQKKISKNIILPESKTESTLNTTSGINNLSRDHSSAPCEYFYNSNISVPKRDGRRNEWRKSRNNDKKLNVPTVGHHSMNVNNTAYKFDQHVHSEKNMNFQKLSSHHNLNSNLLSQKMNSDEMLEDAIDKTYWDDEIDDIKSSHKDEMKFSERGGPNSKHKSIGWTSKSCGYKDRNVGAFKKCNNDDRIRKSRNSDKISNEPLVPSKMVHHSILNNEPGKCIPSEHTSLQSPSSENGQACNMTTDDNERTYWDDEMEDVESFYRLRAKNNLAGTKSNCLLASPDSDTETLNSFSDLLPDLNSSMSELNISEKKKTNQDYKNGFFIKFQSLRSLSDWQLHFSNALEHDRFHITCDSKFRDIFIVSFVSESEAEACRKYLEKLKLKLRGTKLPEICDISNVKKRLKEIDSKCDSSVITKAVQYVQEKAESYLKMHKTKIRELESKLSRLKRIASVNTSTDEEMETVYSHIEMFKSMEYTFKLYVDQIKQKLDKFSNQNDILLTEIQQTKIAFIRECSCFQLRLPIYTKKNDIIHLVHDNKVSVIVAETGSGKSTQLAQFLLQAGYASKGRIICTQPRKIAALSITEYLCQLMGCPVGSVVGYDVGIEKKICLDTKIIYMTDYCLLKECKDNRNLNGISCIIIDEAHERSLYTDLLLAIIKQCVALRNDLRVIITSATLDSYVFKRYFNLLDKAILAIPGRVYPVKVVWWDYSILVGWNYVEECVKMAHKIHTEENEGHILVFLTSPSETEEACSLFKRLFSSTGTHFKLLCLHGRMDIKDQKLIFDQSDFDVRKIIFATNAAETSVTIPGIKYVIDSGMTKELEYNDKWCKSELTIKFTNQSSAEQRKGRAGRSQPGICYRMYSQDNYDEMSKDSTPEILKTNLNAAVLKIVEFGFDPKSFDFVEEPPRNIIDQAVASLEHLGILKDNGLTKLGKNVALLPIEPRLAKLIFKGISEGVAYEALIIAAVVSVSRSIFYRTIENRKLVDEKRSRFCHENGDFYTYLDIYRKWHAIVPEARENWCKDNCIKYKTLTLASKIISEIEIILSKDLSITLKHKYNASAFDAKYEMIFLECFSENLCVFSGQRKGLYASPHFAELFMIHPSSSLCYTNKETEPFIIYNTILKTSRDFLLNVMPISESTLYHAFKQGIFDVDPDKLREFSNDPLVLGPFGESTLVNYILGKRGSKIVSLEEQIQKFTRNFQIDVLVKNGEIVVQAAKKHHERIRNLISEMIDDAHKAMSEDLIYDMSEGSFSLAIGSGGIVTDVMLPMPGHFRELIFSRFDVKDKNSIMEKLKQCDGLHLVKEIGDNRLSAMFRGIKYAQEAYDKLKPGGNFHIKPKEHFDTSSENQTKSYKIHLAWPRVSHVSVLIHFSSVENCIEASALLATQPVIISNKKVQILPSHAAKKALCASNIPSDFDEKAFKQILSKYLPDSLITGTIFKVQETSKKIVESELAAKTDIVWNFMKKYAPPSGFTVDVIPPKTETKFWEAIVYFKRSGDGEKALHSIKGNANIETYKVVARSLSSENIHCSREIYEFVRPDVRELVRCYKKKGECIYFQESEKSSNVTLEISCITDEKFATFLKELTKIIQGEAIKCADISQYAALSTENGKSFLREIQSTHNVLIQVNQFKQTVYLYGPAKAYESVKLKIKSFISKSQLMHIKTFDLKGVNMPSGFVKKLYELYGFNLNDFTSKFYLQAAEIDIFKNTLTLKGPDGKLSEAEDYLEKLCWSLDKENEKPDLNSSITEICPVCFSLKQCDSQRLENCGHVYCKTCILLQIELKVFPLECVKEGCQKPFFTEDIKRALSSCSRVAKESFLKVALHHHVVSSQGKIRYCPTSGCPMVYRSSNDFNKANSSKPVYCTGCKNDICTFCNSIYHKGVSCEYFMKYQADKDHSLKLWMIKDKANRKPCPSCGSVIEKAGGCNHVSCSNCKKHFCWLCSKMYVTAEEVYEHMPYCKRNVVSRR